jgi:hypothetical protein
MESGIRASGGASFYTVPSGSDHTACYQPHKDESSQALTCVMTVLAMGTLASGAVYSANS